MNIMSTSNTYYLQRFLINYMYVNPHNIGEYLVSHTQLALGGIGKNTHNF